MVTTTTPAGLTPAQVAQFHQDGYLIIPDALSPTTIASLLAETHALLNSFSLDDHPMTRFHTSDSAQDHVGDDYFLTSGDKIRFFFEPDAFAAETDPTTGRPSNRLIKPKAQAINKIGHALHALSPPFAALLGKGNANTKTCPNPPAIARALGFRDPRCLQSMVICKQAGIGGAVPPHQDSTFLYTDPPSAVGFWYALEDATRENGCLSFWPGSHRWSPIKTRLVRKPDNSGTTIVANSTGAAFPPGGEYGVGSSVAAVDDVHDARHAKHYVPGEVKAGSLVLIHGNLLHKSERNWSTNKSRIIYTFHIIEGTEGYVYDEKNWLQPPEGGFTRLYKE